jgi:hypothetical protein
MIKGRGHQLNFNNINEDLDFLSNSIPAVHQIKRNLSYYHEIYARVFNNCPLKGNKRYSHLPVIYERYWKTLSNFYFEIHSSNFCCYCGKEGPERLDHFHPSSKVPQFSLLRSNLIRSCTKCNEKKLNRNPVSQLYLEHPYLSNVYDKHELLFDVELKAIDLNEDNDFVFDLDVVPNSSLSAVLKKSVSFSLTELEIGHRVAERVGLAMYFATRNWNSSKTYKVKKTEYLMRASESLQNQQYRDYFCFKLLSRPVNLRRLYSLKP